MSRKEEIIDLANALLQKQGVGSLSFRDIAAGLGIKSSSVHYHFPQKDDLIEAIAANYAETMSQKLAESTRNLPPGKERLRKMISLIRQQLSDRICTAGILAAESASVSKTTITTITQFFLGMREWIAEQLLAIGKTKAEADILASVILAAIEGGLVVDSIGTSVRLLDGVEGFIEGL